MANKHSQHFLIPQHQLGGPGDGRRLMTNNCIIAVKRYFLARELAGEQSVKRENYDSRMRLRSILYS
jgi:hypothetical protein